MNRDSHRGNRTQKCCRRQDEYQKRNPAQPLHSLKQPHISESQTSTPLRQFFSRSTVVPRETAPACCIITSVQFLRLHYFPWHASFFTFYPVLAIFHFLNPGGGYSGSF